MDGGHDPLAHIVGHYRLGLHHGHEGGLVFGALVDLGVARVLAEALDLARGENGDSDVRQDSRTGSSLWGLILVITSFIAGLPLGVYIL